MKRIHPLLSLLALAPLTSAPAQAQWSVDTLSAARQNLEAVTLGDLAFFAGGRQGQTTSAVVDVYDAATGNWSMAVLSIARGEFAATSVGPYVLFAGGADGPLSSTDVVDVYDSTLGAPDNPAAWSTVALNQARHALSATTVGNKAMFAGGGLCGPNNNCGTSDVVDIYDMSIGAPSNSAAWSTETLSEARGGLAAATAGDRAIFAGGLVASMAASATVDIYDDSTGMWTVATLSEARGFLSSVSLGTRVYFAGGVDIPTPSDVVDIYDAQTGLWTDATLSVARFNLAATALGDQVLFGGGAVSFSSQVDVVDVLNASSGNWGSPMHLSEARGDLAAATVGDKALFAGGFQAGQGVSAVVDLYDGTVGTRFECPATVANSSGNAATISATGSDAAADNDLTLTTTGLPDQPNSFGYFLNSDVQNAAGFTPPGSQGPLCIGPGGMGRYNASVFNSAGTGIGSLVLDLAVTPTPSGNVAIQAGETWYFTTWFRDDNPNPTSNFSNGLCITFN